MNALSCSIDERQLSNLDFLGGREMKTRKHRSVTVGAADTGREQEVRREIKNFLSALSSYPDRFARNPYVSFEQHLFSIASGDQQASEGRQRG
jgi:hypothetical protein